MLNAHHARLARLVLDRANQRTRKPDGREARAERRKVDALPELDPTRLWADQQPAVVYSPQSSWNHNKGIVVNEYLGHGFSVGQRRGQGATVKRSRGAAKSL
jgi:hypothetical protein